MDKIAWDMEDAAKWHNSKIFYLYANKLKESSQWGLVPANNRNGTTINDKERIKERWAVNFENLLNRNRVTESQEDFLESRRLIHSE